MKAKIYFLAMAFVALLMVGCSDDDGIQLTQDEIIGDINTQANKWVSRAIALSYIPPRVPA